MFDVSKVLVVAAHPDDETLGCGGTMAALAQGGAEVAVLVLGEGISSRYDAPGGARAEEIEALWDNCRKACDVLGANEPVFAGLPDNRFDTVALLDIVKVIEKTVSGFQPQLVLTQHGGDLNIDHVLTFRATMTALRPVATPFVETVLAYEAPSSTEWAHGQFSPSFEPGVFFDISETMERKLEAMGVYETEDRPFPHPRSRRALQVLAETRGVAAGVTAAEGFSLVRHVRTTR